MAAVLVTLEKSAKGGMQKFFKYVPAVVLCYLIAMFLCTLGVWDMAETKPAYSALKNNLTYAMIFAMLLRCDIRKVLKLGPKMLIGFFSATLTIMIGFVCAFVLMKGTIGSDAWMGLGALCGNWIGDSATGFIVLGIHAVLMLIICKLLKLDLFTAGVASLANIGGTASAPVLAGSYSGSLVPVGILMALMGYVVGTPLAVVCAHIMESLA